MIGQKLGSFLIEAELGQGAMGVVYRGTQEGKDRPAAIKVIAAEQIGKGKSLDRFIREAAILEQFRHPNIVRYLARGKTGATYYYAMEFVPGQTLDRVLQDRETLPWREVVALAAQLCDALQYAHDRGIVHRDLKPSNLMVTTKGQLKLTDFGIAKDLDGTALTATGRTLGTAAYMAPEQIRGTPEVSHKTDLYALGCVIYQLLTGEPPFTGTSPVVLMHAHINQPVPRASAKVEEIPRALDDLIALLMAKAPADRPWDASLVAGKLRELAERADRRESIEMVHAAPGTRASMPSRAEATATAQYTGTATAGGLRPTSGRRKGKKARRRDRLVTLGLTGGFVVVAGAMAYLLWPPGSQYLYNHAKVLMASAEPLDWITARDKYLEPLDQRFPKHEYRTETEGWRDRIDLREVSRRAEVLEKTNLAAFSKPKTEAEATYQTTFIEAEAALKLHHDQAALSAWETMARQIPQDSRENRGWFLLAQKKAQELRSAIERRREFVYRQLQRAAIPEGMAGNEAAVRFSRVTLTDLINRFESYPDVAEFITTAKAQLAALAPPESAPPPQP